MFCRLFLPAKTILLPFVLLVAGFCGACGESKPKTAALPAPPPSSTLPAEAAASEQAIRFLEARVKNDREDFIALNKLASYYLQRLRETGNVDYLELASKAARASLEVLPKTQNIGGLASQAQVEFASHNFAAARDTARELMRLDPTKSYPTLFLADSLLELGDYNQAAAVIEKLEKQSEGATVETRLARLAWLRGDVEKARQRFFNAIILAQDERVPVRETIAWLRWQLGEVHFSVGEYDAAEQAYNDALTTFPDYYRAMAGLARVRSAKGDLTGAIEIYERLIRLLPEPAFVAALGDLYQLSGRDREAAAQYSLVEQINRINRANGALYNRQIALFYADHDLKVEEAYAQAKAEYESRRDIYGADAVAWTALKAGKLAEAQAAIKETVKLGTRDAKLWYHAGMIARAAGDRAAARQYLQRALSLNPQFDALQALQAREALESLRQ